MVKPDPTAGGESRHSNARCEAGLTASAIEVNDMFATILKWFRAERGNIAPLIAIMAVPIVGAFAIATETGSWWTYQRGQQNAADSAVIAAAIRGDPSEGNTVATKYGYTDGTNNVKVDVVRPNCPAGAVNLIAGTSCYQVTITKKVPLYLTQIVGFREGGTVIGTTPAKTISASAIAGTISSTIVYCLGAQNAIIMNGGGTPSVPPPLDGCSMIAGGSLTCTGHAADGVIYGNAPTNGNNGGNQVCGNGSLPAGSFSYADPFHDRVVTALNNMSSCGSTLTGNLTTLAAGLNCYSGNVVIPAGTTVNTGNADTILKISNGSLTINGALNTTGSGTLTVVFTGTQTTNTSGILSFGTSGTMDILSPSGGDWDNMAIVVDPNLQGGSINGGGMFNPCSSATTGSGCPQDITTSGNQVIKFTGTLYDPNGTVNFNGSVDKADNSGDYCILIWAKNIVGDGNEAYVTPSPTKNCYTRDSTLPTTPVVALLQ
jgi:hypothetical protein